MHLRELQYETRFTFCFQGQTQQLYQHLWISGSLKSVLWYWSEMKQSTAITLAVYCNTPLLQEKSCAEGKSCLNSEYCRDWQGLVQLQLPLGGGRGYSCKTWQKSELLLGLATREGDKTEWEVGLWNHQGSPPLISFTCLFNHSTYASRHIHFQRQDNNLKQKPSPLIHWMLFPWVVILLQCSILLNWK